MGTGYTFDFSWLPGDFHLYLRAALITLEIFVYSGVCSIILGLLVGTALTSTRGWVRTPFRIYVEIFRLTPRCCRSSPSSSSSRSSWVSTSRPCGAV